MSVDLIYKHQQKTYSLMKEALKEDKKAAYIFPVGCGKSFPALKYIEENQDKDILFVAPTLEIINQFKRYICKYILGQEVNLRQVFPNLRFVTYQKVALAEKMAEINPEIIIFDEIHRWGAEKWEKGIERLLTDHPNAEIIGMSATPERTDKRDMAYEKFGDDIVYEMSLTQALNGEKEGEVILKGARYERVISELQSDIKGYREQIELIPDEEKRKGLLRRYERLESIIKNSPSIQDIMEKGMQKKNGKYIVFCSNREEMLEIMGEAQEIFGKVNEKINIDYVLSKDEDTKTGKTKRENRLTLEEFEKRENGEELNLLFCVDMLNEGVHIEGIDGEVMFRTTQSPIVYKQQIGRVLSSSKEATETVIIDAVNNWLRQIDTFNELNRATIRGETDKDKKTYKLLELLPEELELLDILEEIRENLKYNNRHTYEEVLRWLELHDGQMPRGTIHADGRNKSTPEMTKEEQDERNLYARWRRTPECKVLEACIGISIEELPEEYAEYKEKIATLRGYGLGLEEKTTYEEIIEWLEAHDGKMPNTSLLAKKDRNEMSQEEKEEVLLYERWTNSNEYKVLKKCKGIPLDELPEEYIDYKEKIAILREYGLGIDRKTAYDELIEWLDSHDSKMPRFVIGKKLKAEMTEEEKREVNLRVRWQNSPECKVLESCIGIPLDELPKEYAEYKEKIAILREYGVGIQKITVYEKLIEWLDEHDGKMPRGIIKENGKRKSSSEMTQEERKERSLYIRWTRTLEYKVLNECRGIPLDKLPEEYVEYKEKIAILRGYGLGLEEKTTYDEIIEWLDAHNGQMPRRGITVNGKNRTRKEMSEEEKREINLRARWHDSQECKVLENCRGIPIEEIPEEYTEYIEKIVTLRGYGLGLEKTTYEELIEWLDSHDSKMPRKGITVNRKQKLRSEMTEEERQEVNLYKRWKNSKEYEILEAFREMPIEEIPEEYREKIQTLRKHEQIRKDKEIQERMKKSVGKCVSNNETTRQELENLARNNDQQVIIDD